MWHPHKQALNFVQGDTPINKHLTLYNVTPHKQALNFVQCDTPINKHLTLYNVTPP